MTTLFYSVFEAVPEPVAEEQTEKTAVIARFCPSCGAPFKGSDLHFGHTCSALRLAARAEAERLMGDVMVARGRS